MFYITWEMFRDFHNSPILHDEDEWDGKYKTYGEMWFGEGYLIEYINYKPNV